MEKLRKISSWVTNPTELGTIVMLAMLALICVPVLANDVDRGITVPVAKGGKVEAKSEEYTLEAMEESMKYLLRTWPRHPAIKYPQWRKRLAEYILEAARAYREDPFLVLKIWSGMFGK